MNVQIQVQRQLEGASRAELGNIDVPAPAAIVIGRHVSCNLRLDSFEVSRQHARVILGPDSFIVEDLSSNGTTISTGDILRRNRASFPYGAHLEIGPFRVTVGRPAAGGAVPTHVEGHPIVARQRPGSHPPINARGASTPSRGVPTHSGHAYPQNGRPGMMPPTGQHPSYTPGGGRPVMTPGPDQIAHDLKNSDELIATRRKIHGELLKNLDFAKIDPNVNDPSLRPRVLTALKRIVKELNAPILEHLDRDAFIGELLEEALGLGPLEPLLADASVTEIMVVDPATIYVERSGKLELTTTRFTDEERVRAVIERIVTPLGRRIDESQPLVDARLADGSRVNAIIRPLALRGSCITIRRFPKKRLMVEDFLRLGSLTPQIARFLERAVVAKKNILISGGTGSGKTTLLNVLSASIPSEERIVTIEDAAELQLHQPHVVSLETKHANMEGKGAFTIRDLVKNSLRMRPDRIVVGECRGGEALDMLQAMNTGHDGSLTTIHANSPVEALSRLETLVLMAGLDLPSHAIREQISRSIHVIVQQTRLTDGTRKITHVSEIDELDPNGRFEVRPIFEFNQTGVTKEGKVKGDFEATGYLPSFLDELMARGLIKPGEPFL
jgi:pilus assembly protein CpaF